MRSPTRPTLPSSRLAAPSRLPICRTSCCTLRKANEEVRAVTRRSGMRARPSITSAANPSPKHSSAGSPLRLTKGSTAIEGISAVGPAPPAFNHPSISDYNAKTRGLSPPGTRRTGRPRLSLGLSDDALVQLLHHRGAQQQSQLADGLGVRRLVHPNARELAIDQIGAHFPRQYAIAPVAYVFEQQQTEHNCGGSGKPTTGAALGPSLEQGLVNDVHKLGIVEQAVGVAHPVFPPAIHW